jgi:hypothetical protein
VQDKNKDNRAAAEAKFKEISEAFEVSIESDCCHEWENVNLVVMFVSISSCAARRFYQTLKSGAFMTHTVRMG